MAIKIANLSDTYTTQTGLLIPFRALANKLPSMNKHVAPLDNEQLLLFAYNVMLEYERVSCLLDNQFPKLVAPVFNSSYTVETEAYLSISKCRSESSQKYGAGYPFIKTFLGDLRAVCYNECTRRQVVDDFNKQAEFAAMFSKLI